MEAAIKQLLEVTLLSSAMIAAVLILRKIFRDRLVAGVVSLLWLLVMVRLLVPVTLEAPVHIDIRLPETAAETAVQPNGFAGAPETEAVPELITQDGEGNTAEPDLAAVEAAAVDNSVRQPSISLWQILFGIWAAGAVAALAVSIRRMHIFSKKIKKRMLLSDKTVAQMAYLGGNVLGIYRNVFVYECECIDSPITCGVIRPKILLPAGLSSKIGQTKTGLILFHELVHIKRQDVLKNYLWLIAKIVYWFNPLVYAASNAFLEDIEIACDEVVKKKHSTAQMLEYSQGLLDVIRLSQGEIKLPTAISFCKDTTKIRKRVENMLKPKRKSKWIMIVTLAVITVFAFGCFTTACMPKTEASEDEKTPDATAETRTIETAEQSEAPSFSPVGTEENALAIVKAHNLTGTDEFRYDELNEDVLPFHIINSVDGTGTLYQIYDFNGEILQAAIETNFNENKATISENEAAEMALPILQILYPDSEATVESCDLSRGTFFDVEGTLYKPSEGSTRKFGMSLNGDGEFCAIIARYDAFFALGVSDELVAKVRTYSRVKDFELDLTRVEEISNGDKSYTIAINGLDSPTIGDQIVRINASDLSLVEYTSRLDKSGDKLALNDAEIEARALGYIAEYFPQLSDVKIVSVGKAYSEGWAVAHASGVGGQIYVSVWADGSIKTIKLMDAIATDLPDKYINAEAIEGAKNWLDEYYLVLTPEKQVTCTRIYMDVSAENRVVYEFEYQSDAPSTRDYSFVAAVTHNLDTDQYWAKVNPVLEELNIISMDEAIEKARQMIAKREGISLDKLQEVDVCRLEVSTVLYYEISFIYDHTTYGADVEADAGKQ